MDPAADAGLRSFIAVPPDHEFPIQNLPYGVFQRRTDDVPHVGVRIGDEVLDVTVLEREGLFRATGLGQTRVFDRPALNQLMAQMPELWHQVRVRIRDLLRHDNPDLRDNAAMRWRVLVPLDEVELRLPVEIGDYTDFYSSRQHAFNVGSVFRGPENALPPNYHWLPIAYHGRASSIVLSGAPLQRPCGQTRADPAERPTFGPTRQLDFELEMGLFAGPGNALGEPIPIAQAQEHIFGLVLVNDWSARDIQKWEYVPLGPFLSKNFATTVSPWVVPLEAVEPFRCASPEQTPEPLPYLRLPPQPSVRSPQYSYDIHLEVALQTATLPAPHVICRTNFRNLYWTMIQQLAHHTVTGCNLRPGDLLASGAISGPTSDSYGSLLELARRGEGPLHLPNGQTRTFLEDGDTVIMRGWCEADGYHVGFGECSGTIHPARAG